MDVEISGYIMGVRKERYEEKCKELSLFLFVDVVDIVVFVVEMGYV